MEIDPAIVARLCLTHDIRTLRVFGSVARGEDTRSSDIDLLAEFDRRKSLPDLVRIERELSEGLGRKVDLLTVDSLSRHMKTRVLGESKLLHERT